MNSKAVNVAQAYFEAMARKDVEGILALASEKVNCESPLGSLEGIEKFRGFQEGFARMIEKLTLKAVYGDDAQAVIVYVADTLPVKGAYVAEYIAVKAGKITSTRVIYDGTPFAAYASSAQPH
jgi:ketosteroid isomerase-like protein